MGGFDLVHPLGDLSWGGPGSERGREGEREREREKEGARESARARANCSRNLVARLS